MKGMMKGISTGKVMMIVCLLWTSIDGFSQDYNSMSVEELKILKEQAIRNEDYQLAARLKEVLNGKKTTAQIKAETQNALDEAIKSNNSEEVLLLQDRLKKIEEIEVFESSIDNAVKEEEFQKAEALKKQRNTLRLALFGVAEQAMPSNESSSKESSNLIVPKIKKSYGMYDLKIDGKYVGTINSKTDLLIKNVPSGSHEIKVYLANLPKEKLAMTWNVSLEGGQTYVANLKGEKANRMMVAIKNNAKDVKRGNAKPLEILDFEKSTETFADNGTNQDFENVSFSKRQVYQANYSYGKAVTNLTTWFTSLPEGTTEQVKFNVGFEATYPLIENLGFVAGWGYHFNLYGYSNSYRNAQGISTSNTTSFYGIDLIASFGYQIEANPYVTVQSLVKAGPAWSYLTVERGGENQSTGTEFQAYFSVGGMFFFNKHQTAGMFTDVNVGTGGNSNFSVGFVTGFVRNHKHRHMHYK